MNPPPAHDLALHVDAVRRMAGALARGEADADDLSQDVLVTALESDRPRSIGAWLRGAGRNVARATARREGRRRRREERSARPERLPSAAERAARLEVEARLVAFVRELPEAQAEVLYLRFWEDLPPRAIAARLDVNVETVKTRLKRALAALRTRLTRATPGGRDAWLSALGFAPLAGAGSAAAKPLVLGVLAMPKLLAAVALVALAAVLWTQRPRPSAAPEPSDDVPVAAIDPDPLDAPEDAGDGRASAAPEPAPPAAPAAETLVVRGTVVDVPADGSPAQARPAAGVTVTFQYGWFGDPDRDQETVTDERGAFRFDVTCDWDGAQGFRIHARGDDERRPAYGDVELGGDEPAGELVLERFAHGGLHGLAVDTEGAPLEGVEIRIGDEVRATSDVDGRFRVATLARGGAVTGRKEGWRAIDVPTARQDERGRWPDVEVVLARTGTLRVLVEDTAGRPVEGLAVRVDPSAAEPYGNERRQGMPGWATTLDATTGADGRAVFDDVWAGHKLQLRLGWRGNLVQFERERDGLALPRTPGATRAGRPLVVPVGGERAVTVRMAPLRRLVGRVLDADGVPVAGARLLLATAEDRYGAPGFVGLDGTADETGRFALDVRALDEPGDALLTAAASRKALSSLPLAESPHVAWRRIDLAAVDEDEEIELRLAPTLAIRGRVVDADGAPVRAQVRATPLDHDLVAGRLPTGVYPAQYSERDGTFVLPSLLPGRYDVRVDGDGAALAEAVEAGTDDLELRLRPSAARVRIEVDTGDVEAKRIIVLYGTLDPRDPDAVDAPALPRAATYDEPGGWPRGALGLVYGGEVERGELGAARYQYWPIEGTTREYGVEPGLSWFGAKGDTADGRELLPMGTGLVRVGAGEHVLRFVLRPATALTGRVPGASAEGDLCVALAGADGRLLPLDVRREELHDVVELDTRGRFRLERVPVGRFELRVGTPDELRAGRARATETVETRADATVDVTVEF